MNGKQTCEQCSELALRLADALDEREEYREKWSNAEAAFRDEHARAKRAERSQKADDAKLRQLLELLKLPVPTVWSKVVRTLKARLRT